MSKTRAGGRAADFTRRRFQAQLGLVGGSSLVMTAMQSLDLMAGQAGDRPALSDKPAKSRVIILGAGISGLVVDQWLGVWVSAGTPPPIAARLNAEIGKALADDKVRKSFIEQAQDPVGGSAAAFATLMREDYDKYARLVKQLNVKVN